MTITSEAARKTNPSTLPLLGAAMPSSEVAARKGWLMVVMLWF